MKKQGIYLIIIGILVIALMIFFKVIGNYQYERDYLSYWNLAEKASTIQQKASYMDQFVASFQNKGFNGEHNALFLKTRDNSFDNNYEALGSLKKRLDEIQKMDITSFQYQTAIQQITQQEQGEAHKMLEVFEGIWWKKSYPFLWYWIAPLIIIASLFCIFSGIIRYNGGYRKVFQAIKENAEKNAARRFR